VNIHHTEELILRNRRITEHGIASNSGPSVGSVFPVGSKDVNV
jgi:hypothetical protein